MERQGKYTTEHNEQCVIFEWAMLNAERYPELNLLYAIPNGSYKSKSAARKFKAEGLRAGCPDMCLAVKSDTDSRWPDEQYNALYIELKRPGGRVSPAQKVWIDWLNEYGNYACVCYGADLAIAKICWYLGIEESE